MEGVHPADDLAAGAAGPHEASGHQPGAGVEPIAAGLGAVVVPVLPPLPVLVYPERVLENVEFFRCEFQRAPPIFPST